MSKTFNDDELEKLIMEGMDVNAPLSEDGTTHLMRAVMQHNKKQVLLLLRNGANPNVKNKLGQTALMLASQSFQEELLQILLEFGADPNLQDNLGQTALMLNPGKNPQGWQYGVDDFMVTSRMTYSLLAYGADVNIVDNSKNSAIERFRKEQYENCNFSALKNAASNKIKLLDKPKEKIDFRFQDLNQELQGSNIENDVRKYGHLMGLKGSLSIFGKAVTAEGSFECQGPAWMEETNSAYLRHLLDEQHKLQEGSQEWLQQQQKIDRFRIIEESYQFRNTLAASTDKLIERYRAGKIVAIPTGWIGHGVGIVIHKDYIAYTNRGNLAFKPTGTYFFKINNKNEIENFIQAMRFKLTPENFHRYLTTVLNTPERGPYQDVQPLYVIKHKPQKTGSCGFVNVKSSKTGAALFQRLEEAGLDLETGLQQDKDRVDAIARGVKADYKDDTRFMRKYASQQLGKKTQDMISYVEKNEQVKKKSEELETCYEILTVIAQQKHNPGKLDEMQRFIEILKVLPAAKQKMILYEKDSDKKLKQQKEFQDIDIKAKIKASSDLENKPLLIKLFYNANPDIIKSFLDTYPEGFLTLIQEATERKDSVQMENFIKHFPKNNKEALFIALLQILKNPSLNQEPSLQEKMVILFIAEIGKEILSIDNHNTLANLIISTAILHKNENISNAILPALLPITDLNSLKYEEPSIKARLSEMQFNSREICLPLEAAIKKNKLGTVEALIKAKANPLEQGFLGGPTILSQATNLRDGGIAKLLLSPIKELNVNEAYYNLRSFEYDPNTFNQDSYFYQIFNKIPENQKQELATRLLEEYLAWHAHDTIDIKKGYLNLLFSHNAIIPAQAASYNSSIIENPLLIKAIQYHEPEILFLLLNRFDDKKILYEKLLFSINYAIDREEIKHIEAILNNIQDKHQKDSLIKHAFIKTINLIEKERKVNASVLEIFLKLGLDPLEAIDPRTSLNSLFDIILKVSPNQCIALFNFIDFNNEVTKQKMEKVLLDALEHYNAQQFLLNALLEKGVRFPTKELATKALIKAVEENDPRTIEWQIPALIEQGADLNAIKLADKVLHHSKDINLYRFLLKAAGDNDFQHFHGNIADYFIQAFKKGNYNTISAIKKLGISFPTKEILEDIIERDDQSFLKLIEDQLDPNQITHLSFREKETLYQLAFQCKTPWAFILLIDTLKVSPEFLSGSSYTFQRLFYENWRTMSDESLSFLIARYPRVFHEILYENAGSRYEEGKPKAILLAKRLIGAGLDLKDQTQYSIDFQGKFQNPLSNAIQNSFTEMATLLEENGAIQPKEEPKKEPQEIPQEKEETHYLTDDDIYEEIHGFRPSHLTDEEIRQQFGLSSPKIQADEIPKEEDDLPIPSPLFAYKKHVSKLNDEAEAKSKQEREEMEKKQEQDQDQDQEREPPSPT